MRRIVTASVSLLAVLVLVAACGTGGGTSSLTGKTWQLTAVTEKVPAFQGVIPTADQPRYTINFGTDGTYTGLADCNSITGKYTTSGSNGITIQPGASTLMACPDDSFGPLYAHALTTVTTWAVANNELTLTRADGGTLTFAAGTGASPAPASVAPSAATASSAPATDLTGITWQLSGMTEKVPAFQGVVPAADQSKYTITFSPDGTFSAKADCNMVAGTYVVGASNALTIHLGPSTLALCPEGSLADLYTFALGNAESYVVANDQLTINLQDGGTLSFVKGA